MSELDIQDEFIEENKNDLSQFMPKSRRRGPYSKEEKESRRNEVYRLHFDYGYSARKISELMKVNRNTINGDINYWYSKISKNRNIFNPESTIITNLQRLELQRSRIREKIDKTESIHDSLAFERLIYDIDSKILYTHARMAENTIRIINYSTDRLNRWMKENKKIERYLSLFDKIMVSAKAREKIDKIIEEDRKIIRGSQN